MTDTLREARELAREIREGLPGVTPGPWTVHEQKHPWVLPPKPEWDRSDEKRGHHTERFIITTWDHPQAKAPISVVGGSVGIGEVEPVHMVSIEEADANHLARLDPQSITKLLDALEYLSDAYSRGLQDGIAAERWQPIETAPKDGTRVWLINGVMREPVIGQWGEYRSPYSDAVTKEWMITHDPCEPYMPQGYGSLVIPTLWQPLPAQAITEGHPNAR